MGGLLEYLKNSRAELRRVTWPTRDEVIQATQATLIFVILTVIFLLITDAVMRNLTGLVL